MSQSDRNYWIEQAKARVLANEKRTDSIASEMMFLYDEAANQIENDINAMFSKFAKDNQLTEAEASRLLSDKEYSVWRKSIQEYIKDATGLAGDSKTLLELNTLAMKSRISRKEQLLSNVYQTMADLAQDTTNNLTELLGDLVKVNYYEGCWRMQKGLGFGFHTAKINESLIRSILEFPWAEKHYSKVVWGRCDHLAALTKHEISLGFIQGSSVQKMVKGINDVMGSGKYAAERLVRTECSYFSGQGELAAYKENGIKQYRFLGGSEGSTGACGCAALNGKIFDISAADTGVNYPPMHPNCLCTTVAYFSNSIFDAPADAKPLPDNIKFQDWKKEFVDTPAIPAKMSLTDADRRALQRYINSDSYKLNDKLRHGAKLSIPETMQMRALDAALDKLPEHRGVVYRSVSSFGIDDVDAFIKSHLIGAPRKFPSYISSNINEVYDKSMEIQYIIISRHGRDISKFNPIPGENEVLFRRNTIFVTTKIEGHTIYMEEL